MLSIFQTTNQGNRTRSQLLQALQQNDGLTRSELAQQSGLSYEQVRNQTQNLISQGAIVSRDVGGKRRYYMRIFALLLAICLPIFSPSIDEDDVSLPDQNLTDCW